LQDKTFEYSRIHSKYKLQVTEKFSKFNFYKYNQIASISDIVGFDQF